jgi:SAM-dependent methyltransferase
VAPQKSICDQFYDRAADPWGFRTRWYERRKREIVVASLPRRRFEKCWELGCSVGELTAALAARCDRILATDGNTRAVAQASERVRDFAHVQIEQQIHPEEWPRDQFDLIIFSELGYNFEPASVRAFAQRFGQSLTASGVLVACHWRHPIEGCPTPGDNVHRIIAETLALPRVVHHAERDFLLEIWSADTRSLAETDGIL